MLSVPEKHQKKIALSTLRMSHAGALIMGGMTKKQAREFLKEVCKWSAQRIDKYEEG